MSGALREVELLFRREIVPRGIVEVEIRQPLDELARIGQPRVRIRARDARQRRGLVDHALQRVP
jgi:hypothetical protein